MTIKKRKTHKGYVFFNDGNFQPQILEIFSYMKDNDTVLNFSRTCNQVYSVFKCMVEKSSQRLYLLSKINRQNPKEQTFGLFENNLKPKYQYPNYRLLPEVFVKDFSEFEKNIGKEGTVFLKILENINKEFGNCCFIGGGFVLRHLLKEKKFSKIKDLRSEVEDEDFRNILNKDINKDVHSINKQDIDVFIVGNKKEKIALEIVTRMQNQFKHPENFVVETCSKIGVYDINFYKQFSTIRSRLDFFEMKKQEEFDDILPLLKPKLLPEHVEHPVVSNGIKYYQSNPKNCVFQLILLKNYHSPSDILNSFDLGICRTGFFPGTRKIFTVISFIRSIYEGMNYANMTKITGGRQVVRICKYYRRFLIYTTTKHEHMLSYYHTFKRIQKKRKKCLKFIKYTTYYGINSKDDLYELDMKITNNDQYYDLNAIYNPNPNAVDNRRLYVALKDCIQYPFFEAGKDTDLIFSRIDFEKNKETLKFEYKKPEFDEYKYAIIFDATQSDGSKGITLARHKNI